MANAWRATTTIDTGKSEGSKGNPFVKLSLNGLAPGEDDDGNPADVIVSSRNFALTGVPGIGDGTLPDAGAVRAMGLALTRFADRIDAGRVAAVKSTGAVPLSDATLAKQAAKAANTAPAATLPTL